MADYLSSQLTNADAEPAVLISQNERGKIRAEYFSYIVPVGDVAVGSTVELARPPVGARIIGGKLYYTAMGSARTIALGDGVDDDEFLAALDVSGAGMTAFAATIALGFGTVFDGKSLVATVAGDALPAGETISGILEYLID